MNWARRHEDRCCDGRACSGHQHLGRNFASHSRQLNVDEAPARGMRMSICTQRLVAALLSVLLLLTPALWNGFPLLQYDTGGYLARWYEGTLEVSRSTVYGLFLVALARPDFWPVVIVQSA